MAQVTKSVLVPYTVEQMYNLVNDVESYPRFLPWCKAADLHSKQPHELKATLHLAKGPISQSITTVNQMQPFSRISMQYLAGPFKSCSGSWEFLPQNNGQGCQILFNMEYQFKNKLTAIALEPVFHPLANTLIEAFQQRAAEVYGS